MAEKVWKIYTQADFWRVYKDRYSEHSLSKKVLKLHYQP